MLIVIAIIALLASILFPVFARARESARKATCQSNLKQIGLGILQYVQDYDEVLPSAANGSTDKTTGSYYRWQDAIYSYVKSEQIFNCPSHANTTGYKAYKYQATPLGTQINGRSNGSYAINSLYYSNQSGPVSYLDIDQLPAALLTTLAPKKMAVIGVPAETVWSFDVYGNVFFLPAVNTPTTDSPTIRTNIPFPYLSRNGSDGVVGRHMEMTNVLWADGHVKAVTIEFLATKSGSSLKYFTAAND